MEEINQQYRELCVVLGDIEVKIKGLSNQRASIFKQLEELDVKAQAKIKESEEEKHPAAPVGSYHKVDKRDVK